MPRTYRGPRLYFKRLKNRAPMWVIRDGYVETSTGTSDQAEAEKLYRKYCDAYGTGPRPTPLIVNEAVHIYFISTSEVPDYPIKIGKTQNLEYRLAALQSACPYRLEIINSYHGCAAGEKILHIDYHKDRLNGEWFRRTPELMAEIERLCSRTFEDAA